MHDRSEPLTVSAKLKMVMQIREHLLLSPEEYRRLLNHVVRDHLTRKHAKPADVADRDAANDEDRAADGTSARLARQNQSKQRRAG